MCINQGKQDIAKSEHKKATQKIWEKFCIIGIYSNKNK